MQNTEMTKDEYIKLFEKCEKEGAMNLIYFLMGSLLSSDTMVDIESCENSIREFTVILDALKEASISEDLRNLLTEIAENGIQIGKRDRAFFAGEESGNDE